AITAPAPGGTYTLGASVPTTFACLGSCQDSNGLAAPSGFLSTGSAGPQVYSVTSDANGLTFTAELAYAVATATPVLAWGTPGAITYGTPLSASQLDATASVPGTFVYNPPAGTVLGAGNQTLAVTFTPMDQTDYTTASKSVSLHVAPAPLTITASSNAEPYGLAIPPVTPSYSGFVNHDGASSLTPAPTCTTPATAGSPVGTYATTCSGAVDPNYTINYVAGTIVITKAATTLVAAPISFLGSVLSVHVQFSATLTSNVTGKGIPSQAVTFTWASGHCTVQTNASGVATCAVFNLNVVPLTLVPHYTATFEGTANYQGTSGTGTLKLA
ncbi:MAG TPA: MBG domain-containing protein, partial [Acidimicrobiales bacterium]|nr:MBG domain-containing protein [Acidimicrobiales bacterium]